MPKKGLHAILGTGRVRKARAPRASPSKSTSTQPTSASTPTQPTSTSTSTQPTEPPDDSDDEPDVYTPFDTLLTDCGLLTALTTDLHLRDVAQALGISRARMFSPIPLRGLRSTRIPALHARRATIPALTTQTHLHAMLPEATRTEREVAELVREGVVRRVSVARASEVELLILERDLERMLAEGVAEDVFGEEVRQEYTDWLKSHPGQSVVQRGDLNEKTADELVRAGFLTGQNPGMASGERARLRLRPDERTSFMSLDRVSRAASGSAAAVGGAGAIYEAGGGGVMNKTPSSSSFSSPRTSHDLDIAVPGQGTFLRLATAGVEHLVSLLQTRSRFGQAPEVMMREWWDCATPPQRGKKRRKKRATGNVTTGNLPTGDVGVVMPDRTTKWRVLEGMAFDWALEEAVGGGAVEVFDAGGVGRGVRLLNQ